MEINETDTVAVERVVFDSSPEPVVPTLPLYLRKTPMIYTIVNEHQKKDPDTEMIQVIQGITARFTNNEPGQVAQFDGNRMIDRWIRNELTSGRLEHENEATKREWLVKTVKKFVEKHPDFQRKLIWIAPTKTEIREGLEERKKKLEAEIASLQDIVVTDQDVTAAIEKATSEVNPTTKKFVHGGGVVRSGSTSANKRST